MALKDQTHGSESHHARPSAEVQTIRSGELREIEPGHFEITVAHDAEMAIEAQAAEALQKINRLNSIEGVPAELGESSRRSIELVKNGARESLAEILGSDEDIEAALGSLSAEESDAPPKSYASEVFQDTLKTSEMNIESPTIRLEQAEDFPELPSQGLTDAILHSGIDAGRVIEIDKLLRSRMSNKYNREMASNQIPAFITGFKNINKALDLEMSDAIISGLIGDLEKVVPIPELKLTGGSQMERRMAVNTALPDSWQTKEIRDQLAIGQKLDVLADLQNRFGNEKLAGFLSALPEYLVKNSNVMSELFSKESGRRLAALMEIYPDISTVPEVLAKLSKIITTKPYLIPRILSSAAFPTIEQNLASFARGGAMQSSDTLELMLGQFIDTKPPIEEPIATKGPAERRSLRATFRAAE